jgi:putative hydrolase of the HAD superfamily
MKYKAIVFDFFGVISSEVAPFWFEKYLPGPSPFELKEKYVHPADRGEISDKELFYTLAKLASITPEKVRDEWLSMAKIDKSIVTLILVLKKKFKIILCSNAPSEFLREIISGNKLENLFDFSIISSEIHAAKPDLRVFKKIFEVTRYQADEIVFVDDNSEYTLAAETLGIKSIRFQDANQLIENFNLLGISLEKIK